ncbi:MAG TPA: hypothetical protein VGR26_08700 [Acidimicrobiales bacterium]|nr:hypothetical protein [Acidimicrobiales bacterium]
MVIVQVPVASVVHVPAPFNAVHVPLTWASDTGVPAPSTMVTATLAYH